MDLSGKLRYGATVAVLSLCIGCSGGGGGGGDGVPASNPSEGIFAGNVVDENGTPVVGARVSIEGVEAETLTDASGNYYVSDSSLAIASAVSAPGTAAAVNAEVEASVIVPGYEPRVLELQVAEGERVNIDLIRNSLGPRLTVISPTGEKIISVPTACEDPRVLVEGYAKLAATESFQLDVVVVVDRSGSTSREAFDVDGDEIPDSVLDAELSATQCFLGTLDPDTSRVAIVQFNDSAEVVRPFSNDLSEAIGALEEVEGSTGGTNYEAAFVSATELFLDLAADDEANEEPSEDPAPEIPTPYRAVIFLSDGVPTSHGVPRDMNDSNLTQSREDRLGAVDAARSLGEQTGAELFGYSIISAEDTNLARTTLPHCVAICGGGDYQNIDEVTQLESALCGRSLVSALNVEIANVTDGGTPVTADLFPDGFFSELVPVSLLAGEPDANGVVTNVMEISLTAFSGELAASVREIVNVRLISEADLTNLNDDDLVSTQSNPVAVASLEFLSRPTGGALGDNKLHSFLLGEYEDAVELQGVETFKIVDPTGSGGTMTLQVDFVFKEACYKSDFGYFIYDVNDPPTSAAEALADATDDNILLNSGDIGNSNCSLQSIAAGTAQFDVDIDAGEVVAFFILPNRRLAQYQANPNHRLRPLFTVPSLNPGGFDQVLSFRSQIGRTEPGESQTVVTGGPLTVFAFEDLAIARSSDQDFTDVVFTVTDVIGRVDGVECD